MHDPVNPDNAPYGNPSRVSPVVGIARLRAQRQELVNNWDNSDIADWPARAGAGTAAHGDDQKGLRCLQA